MTTDRVTFDDAARALNAVAGDLREPDANRHAAALAYDVLTSASRTPRKLRRIDKHQEQPSSRVAWAVQRHCGAVMLFPRDESDGHRLHALGSTTRVLGTLVDVLHRRGLLSENDLLTILEDRWEFDPSEPHAPGGE